MIGLGLLSAILIYLYPSYATYKVLAKRPGTEAEVEKWLIYWCVVGAFVAFEKSFEWLVHWVIFYSDIKALVLLFISQGGTGVIYHGFLSQHYAQYEPEIDQHIADIKTQTSTYIQERLQDLFKAVTGAAQSASIPPSGAANQTYGDLASRLWSAYGGSALATRARILSGTGGAAFTNGAPSPNAFSGHEFGFSTSVDPKGPPVTEGGDQPNVTPTLPRSTSGNNRSLSPSPSQG
ncbi:TB2/DP1, HVA22 family-domain-containing protein [Cantharellus anzutake]|uniref:TB2/DP1, HVA22 family-domain-containing protein n=1 Tax=Cantharellus anzutake TaxID=1750568 RepID=UPI001907BC77|nr:TB2/DP1, HVA22 family-domain-containing protein [Cantharellus anzutake]KAF8332665.1 TB2/DP1, HVA22 family-domain-containing protein [Cantharellus anzutake]